MTAEQAIDIIKCLAWHKRPSEKEIEDAIKALEQQPQDGDRAVSLKAVIEAIDVWDSYAKTIERIKQLPSVSQPKTGYWIMDLDYEHGRCSKCGHREDLVDGRSSYEWCSSCGARMVGDGDAR